MYLRQLLSNCILLQHDDEPALYHIAAGETARDL